MKLGFTGTRQGATADQLAALAHYLLEHSITEFHHGDCTGADEDVHALLDALKSEIEVVIHPPMDTKHHAFCFSKYVMVASREVLPKPYLDRNKDIVDAADMLIAFPEGFKEEQRSGTWSTVRYAKRQHKPYLIVWPDGKVESAP